MSSHEETRPRSGSNLLASRQTPRNASWTASSASASSRQMLRANDQARRPYRSYKAARASVRPSAMRASSTSSEGGDAPTRSAGATALGSFTPDVRAAEPHRFGRAGLGTSRPATRPGMHSWPTASTLLTTSDNSIHRCLGEPRPDGIPRCFVSHGVSWQRVRGSAGRPRPEHGCRSRLAWLRSSTRFLTELAVHRIGLDVTDRAGRSRPQRSDRSRRAVRRGGR